MITYSWREGSIIRVVKNVYAFGNDEQISKT